MDGIDPQQLTYKNDDTIPPKWSFYYMVNLFLTLLCAVTTVVMIYVTVLIRRKTDDQELVIPAMLVFLILALVSKYPLEPNKLKQVASCISRGQWFAPTAIPTKTIPSTGTSSAR